MADFSASDIDEAKRRVREMRNRAQSFVNRPEETQNNGAPQDKPQGQCQSDNAPNRERGGGSDFMGSLFGDMFKSDDSALILALVMILSREGADNMLILALLYILL